MADETGGGTQPAPPAGNPIVPNPPERGGTLPWYQLLLAGAVVGAGIYLVDQWDSRAAWALTFLVLLMVAFAYPNFGTQLTTILQGGNQPSPGNRIVPNPPDNSSNGFVVGPLGAIGG